MAAIFAVEVPLISQGHTKIACILAGPTHPLPIDEEAVYKLTYEVMLKRSPGWVRPWSFPGHVTIIEFAEEATWT